MQQELNRPEVQARPVRFLQTNSRRAGTKGYQRYDAYKSATTLLTALSLGAQKGDLVTDLDRGFVTFLDGLPPPSVGRKRSTVAGEGGATAKKARRSEATSIAIHEDEPTSQTNTRRLRRSPRLQKKGRKDAPPVVVESLRYSFPRRENDTSAEAEYEILADGSVLPEIDGNSHQTIRILGPSSFVKHPIALRNRVLEVLEDSVESLKELHLHHFDFEQPSDILESIAQLFERSQNLLVLGAAHCEITPHTFPDLAHFKSIRKLDLRGSIDVKHAFNSGFADPYTEPFIHVVKSMPNLKYVDLEGVLDDEVLANCVDEQAIQEAREREVYVNLGDGVSTARDDPSRNST